MNQVTLKKTDLLKKIEENRILHLSEYQTAHKSWQQDTVAYHTHQTEYLAKHGKEDQSSKKGTEPKSYIAEYDRAIAMLKVSVDAELTISSVEFDRYYLDNWQWSTDFKSAVSAYK